MNIQVHEIDSTVPMPETRGLPISQLQVGESVAFPFSKHRSVRTRVSAIARKEGKKFTVRKIDADTGRVWRTE